MENSANNDTRWISYSLIYDEKSTENKIKILKHLGLIIYGIKMMKSSEKEHVKTIR